MQGTLRPAMSEARDLLPFSWVIAYSRLVACINFFSAANLDEGFCCKFFSFLSLCRRFGARQRERGKRLFIRVGYPFLYLFPFLLCSFRRQTRAAAAAQKSARKRLGGVRMDGKMGRPGKCCRGGGKTFLSSPPPFSPSLF